MAAGRRATTAGEPSCFSEHSDWRRQLKAATDLGLTATCGLPLADAASTAGPTYAAEGGHLAVAGHVWIVAVGSAG